MNKFVTELIYSVYRIKEAISRRLYAITLYRRMAYASPPLGYWGRSTSIPTNYNWAAM